MFRKSAYNVYRLGDGMKLYDYNQSKKLILINSTLGHKFLLLDEIGNLKHITKEDIDYDRVNKLEKSYNAKILKAPYYFTVGNFLNGVCMLSWTLYPDGRYFADKDGFGSEDNDETTIYAFMDMHGKVIIPFRDIEKKEFNEIRRIAENKVKMI